ncbi:MAG: DUF5615 family PIN-like protein [Planctomycetota bacterium]
MNILADENVNADLVAWLRRRGHDVLFGAVSLVGLDDRAIAKRCEDDVRVLVTEDKGFGDRIARGTFAPVGLVLLRFGEATKAEQMTYFANAWPGIEDDCVGAIVVIEPLRVRARKLKS